MAPNQSGTTPSGPNAKKTSSVLRKTDVVQQGLKHSDQHSRNTTTVYKRTRKVFFQWLAKTQESLAEEIEFTIDDINLFFKDQFDNENKKANGDLYTTNHYETLKNGLRDLCAEHGMLDAYKAECKPLADRLMKLYTGLYKDLRANTLDDLNGIQRESITLEEFHEGAAEGYNKFFNCKTPRLKLKNLRSLCDYLFGTYTMMRSCNRRGAMLSHFCLEELTHCPPAYKSKAKVLCIMKNVEKSLTDRDIKVSRIIRANDITYCPVFCLSLYWYHRYDIMKQEFPDFSKKREWYNKMPVFSTLTNSSNVLSAGAFHRFCKDYADDIHPRTLDNPTHYMRKTGAKLAGEYFVPLSEICKQGGWSINEEVVKQFYMDCQPSTYLFRTHGHSINVENVAAKLDMKRAILNYESVAFRNVERMIFPWIEEVMEPVLNKQREEDAAHEEMIDIQIRSKQNLKKGHISNQGTPTVNMEIDTDVAVEAITAVASAAIAVAAAAAAATTPDVVDEIEDGAADLDLVAANLEDAVEEQLDARESWTRSVDKRLENIVLCLRYMRQVFVEDLVELSFRFPDKVAQAVDSNILNSPYFQLLVKAAGSFKEDPNRFYDMANKEYEGNLSTENADELLLLSLLDKFVIRELWVDIERKKTCTVEEMRMMQNQLMEANKRNEHLGATMGVSVSLSQRFTRESEQMEIFRDDAFRTFHRIEKMNKKLHEMTKDMSNLKSIATSLLIQNSQFEKLLASNSARNDRLDKLLLKFIEKDNNQRGSGTSLPHLKVRDAIKLNPTYNGPYYHIGNFQSVSVLYTEWKNKIIQFDKMSKSWLKESGNSRELFNKVKNCVRMIDCLNDCYHDPNETGIFVGCSLLEEYITEYCCNSISSFLTVLPAPRNYTTNGEFRKRINGLIKQLKLIDISGKERENLLLVLQNLGDKNDVLPWESQYAQYICIPKKKN